MIRRLSGKSCWLDVEPVFSGRSADSIFGRQHTRSRINKLYLLAYLHTMALSFFISLFVTYTDIANRQATNIFFAFSTFLSFSRDSLNFCTISFEKKEKNACRSLALRGRWSCGADSLFSEKYGLSALSCGADYHVPRTHFSAQRL